MGPGRGRRCAGALAFVRFKSPYYYAHGGGVTTPSELEGGYIAEMAGDDDWEHIIPGFVEGTWNSLGSRQRDELGLDSASELAVRLSEWIRSEGGLFNQAFVVKTSKGVPAGHVWLARIINQFTGMPEALVINVFVEEEHRGKGLGRKLMEIAEDWAKGLGLEIVSLNVGPDNELALHVFDSLGYEPESKRMSKRL